MKSGSDGSSGEEDADEDDGAMERPLGSDGSRGDAEDDADEDDRRER